MNKTQLIVIIVAVFLLIVLAIVLFSGIFFKKTTDTQNPNQNPFGFNNGTTTVVTPSQGQQDGKIPLKLSNGTLVYTSDFTKTDQPAWASDTSGYQVAGSATDTFLITYILPDKQTGRAQFLLTILAEPLGATRKAAEQAFRAKLGLTDAQLCALDVDVEVGPGVNDTYRGRSLGLSFCPGAVPLP